ncbi:MAG: hypothetical protein JO020_12875 [Chloroflexi bacterium]|nr:hypothetical protein [Chloroflexota bacterium]MBV9895055.1 hypothetical protein [Chloroflexota bacterium]
MRADLRGNRLLVGSRRLLEDFGIAIPPQVLDSTYTMRRHGETVLNVGIDDRFIGLIGVADAAHHGASHVVRVVGRRRGAVRRLLPARGARRHHRPAVERDLRGVDRARHLQRVSRQLVSAEGKKGSVHVERRHPLTAEHEGVRMFKFVNEETFKSMKVPETT